ncbi:MAG TPA: fumarylacetoacetate hydrolase family protein [Pinirhizobacter sp.]|uniref:fumarylacetoacetate hydrolase family protein n=1 Tax=Pinirhizobacter sp. TaxID=2950432 RepID=UPI002CBC5498|nr:fumarylacetoacetate hydrolase family protein [Pinirhizobacter sp.]HMH66634.1 fumarylacetoacetate hydrolase family protein [Pinirhizobacter sp.]
MKLFRHGNPGAERPGLVDADGVLRDLHGKVDDITGATLSPASLNLLASIDPSTLPRLDAGVRLGPAVGQVGKMICVGMNYADHAAETGAPIPEQPVLFMKATTAIMGPNDDVVIPRGSVKTDWEVELGVVIGTVARDVTVDEALGHVAGFMVVNDLSEREFQMEHGGQWVKGKSCDTFGPLGPWLVTTDDIPDPQNLDLWLSVNEHRYQSSNTRNMVFGVAKLVSYISRYMTLMPGDVISTGTPAGVGLGLKPPTYLKPGDVMELGIEGLGTQRQVAHAHRADR